jgi:hypothetical protein
MNLKKVLIADGGDHYKILEQIYHLLHDKCELTFYIVEPRRYDYKELFPSAVNSRVLTCDGHGVTFFVWLLFYGARYDVINISTGPDGSHFNDALRVAFFYLCCLVHGRRIVLTLRNIHPYLESTPGVFAFVRSRSVRHVKRFTFETDTMRRVFARGTRRKDVRLAVSYDKYTDVTVPGDDRSVGSPRDGKIRIGLLGTVNEERRDYAVICDALQKVPAELRSHLTFVTLGECREGMNHKALRALSAFVGVDSSEGLLSEREFAARGRSCELLMAPLTEKRAYGSLSGSGSFGDAIYLQKRLIVPRHADSEGEFAAMCIYYSDAGELAAILCNVPNELERPIPSVFLEKFTTENVYQGLLRDLRMC